MMCLGRRLARSLGRPLHTGHVSFALVKKEFIRLGKKGYVVPLKTEEKVIVLKKLNTLSATDLECYLSPKLSESIIAHREHRGLFNSLENLLDVDNIRVARAEKVFQVLLKDADNTQYREFFDQAIVPEVNMEYYSKLEEPDITTLGISLDLNRVAFSKIDGTGKILHWDLCPVMDPTSLASIISYQHQNIFKVASDALDSLPEADFYLLEEMKPILAKEQGMKSLVHLLRLRSVFLCLLMERREAGGSARVHTMKPGVVDRMFNLKIGNERKSIQDSIFNMGPQYMGDQYVERQSYQISRKFPLSMSSGQHEWWRGCDNLAREKLLTCLAQGLAFNHLCSCEAKGQFD